MSDRAAKVAAFILMGAGAVVTGWVGASFGDRLATVVLSVAYVAGVTPGAILVWRWKPPGSVERSDGR